MCTDKVAGCEINIVRHIVEYMGLENFIVYGELKCGHRDHWIHRPLWGICLVRGLGKPAVELHIEMKEDCIPEFPGLTSSYYVTGQIDVVPIKGWDQRTVWKTCPECTRKAKARREQIHVESGRGKRRRLNCQI